MNKPFKLGLVGCGLRGTGYVTYLRRLGIKFTVEAIADVNEVNLKSANRTFAQNKANLFKSGEELINNSDLDAVVVATPNKFHRGPAIAAIKKGLPTLLEKPIATTFDDLAAIWDAYVRNNGKLVVGFGLRYTPFYQKIKEILNNGMLGQILTIHAEELMSDRLSMIFCRSQWRPDPSLAGPLLLEKCCHDIDLINWFSDSKAVKLSSHAKRSFLIPNKGPNRTCGNCPDESKCRFSRKRTLESFQFNMTDTQTDNYELYLNLINDKCPYHIGTHYPDHQSVIIEYENGVLCTFNVIQLQPANRRTIHILGTEARLYGVIDDNYFTIFHRTGPNNEKPEIVKVHPDEWGHNGAEKPLITDFLNLIEGKPNPWRPGPKEGIESAIICIVADESIEQGRSIDLAEYRNRVLGQSEIRTASPAKAASAH